MAAKPTRETWNKTSITMRCPGCGKVNRMLVGLKGDDDKTEPVKPKQK